MTETGMRKKHSGGQSGPLDASGVGPAQRGPAAATGRSPACEPEQIERRRFRTSEAARQLRGQMLRHREALAHLPYATRATCPRCGREAPAEFRWADERQVQMVLRYACAQCGTLDEVHHDTVWSTPAVDRVGSALETSSGHVIKPNARVLPRTVQTLCPE